MVAGSLVRRTLVAAVLVSVARADVMFINRTIDDQLGDEVTGRLVDYSPPGFWSQGNGCDHCAFHPDNQSAFDGTWHDGSRVPSHDVEPLALSFKFNGTAVYVFNILVRLALTDVNITLDGQFVTRYTIFPNISEQYKYEIPVFSQEDIPYGEHTVGMSAFGPNQTVVLFDYAIYTTNVTEPSPTSSSSPSGTASGSSTGQSSHKNNTGAIAGGVVGGVVVVAALLLAYLLHRRSLRPRVITPFNVETQHQHPDILDAHSEEKIANVGQDAKSPDFVSPMIASVTRGESSSSSAGESTQGSDAELRQGIQALRVQLEAARAERGMSSAPIPPSQTSSLGSFSKTPVLESELQSLRAEVEQLRARQDTRESTQTPSSPATTDLVREIAMLRAEMDEIREISHGPLPGYSPPARPLPGFPSPASLQ